MNMLKTLAILVFSLYAVAAYGGTPELRLPYSKKLTVPLTSSKAPTPMQITFSLYDSESDGRRYWEETKTLDVSRTTLEIATTLGDSAAFPLNVSDFNNQLWVQVETNGAVVGSREKLQIAPYAIWSATSNVPGLPGPTGPQGPAGPQGMQGVAGASGYNSLMSAVDEVPGANCARGGTKLQVGLDANRNNILESAEVVQTKYFCNGEIPSTSTPITVTATPSTQTARFFTEVTARVNLKNADGTYVTGPVTFRSSGTCGIVGSVASLVNGTASTAMTSNSWNGGPCIAYADYHDDSTNTNYTGSTLVTFTPYVPNVVVTVTASPSSPAVNTYTRVTATAQNADDPGYPADGTPVTFTSSGTCFVDHAQELTVGGIASVAVTSTSAGPCIVYADFLFRDPADPVKSSGSTLITFVSN